MCTTQGLSAVLGHPKGHSAEYRGRTCSLGFMSKTTVPAIDRPEVWARCHHYLQCLCTKPDVLVDQPRLRCHLGVKVSSRVTQKRHRVPRPSTGAGGAVLGVWCAPHKGWCSPGTLQALLSLMASPRAAVMTDNSACDAPRPTSQGCSRQAHLQNTRS